MNTTPYISIIIPAYRESVRIVNTLTDIRAWFRENSEFTYEVIVVDDGSPDQTSQVVKKFAQTWTNLKLIRYDVNRGKGYAVRVGMQHATGELRLFMDADNSTNISNLTQFIKKYNEGFDVVIASIRTEGATALQESGFRNLMSTLSQLLIRTMARLPVNDTQRGFKLFSREASSLIFLKQTIERYAFDIEILTIANLHGQAIHEMPVAWSNPPGDNVRLSSYVKTLVDLFKIRSNVIMGKYGYPN